MPDATEQATPVESPPPTPVDRPDDDADDPRRVLHRLAQQLTSANNRALLIEYLRLRRLIQSS